MTTTFFLFSTPGDPTWYLVGQGWLGLFYYETGGSEAPGSGRLEDPRSGAYLYPDYSNAVVGLWMDHLLLQVNIVSKTFSMHNRQNIFFWPSTYFLSH